LTPFLFVDGRGAIPSRVAVKLLGFVALLLLAASLTSVTTAAQAAAPAALRFGYDDPLFASPESEVRERWLEQARDTSASIVRIDANWRSTAPESPPAGFDASNPASSAYDWETLDDAVRSAVDNGLAVMLTVHSAPRWAEGPGRPGTVEPGSWKPQPRAYEAFAKALATRYSGSFPDPLLPGEDLPRVRYFEAWNEPNLETYLSPQWEGNEWVGASRYRGLLNAFYSGVKTSQATATVIGGSLAPFGDPPGGERTPPVLFLRSLLCLHGGKLTPVSCPEPAHFDVLSDHPIAVGPPAQSASSPLDVTTPDMGHLTTILEKAERDHLVLPRSKSKKPLWVTEFWYDTDPPDPNGLSLATQARWYEQDLYSFWQQGAQVAIELQIRDAPPGKGGYAFSNQSGAYFLDGSPKPSATAFRFPLVAHRTGPFKVAVWGIAPEGGKVKIQVLRNNKWKMLATISTVGRPHPFVTTVELLRFGKLRAVQGSDASLPWTQR
jgi:Cellulase (glycosyl hydrolase family 5)